jgi:light-regulated signal transduction histidine kinase (bacteriophytochrome)
MIPPPEDKVHILLVDDDFRKLSALETVLADLQTASPDRGVQVIIADGLAAAGDPGLLRQVLENLLGNAWKFTGREPQPRIEFGVARQEREPAFFVRDNGAGFDPAFANKLFGPFQRLHSAEEFPGSGIGLAIVQRVIHGHGGRIWAQAARDRERRFSSPCREEVF